MNKYGKEAIEDFHKTIQGLNNEELTGSTNYQELADKYADERGIIFYELENNIMTYEEQVKDSRTSYGLYTATVDLDTGEVTQEKAK